MACTSPSLYRITERGRRGSPVYCRHQEVVRLVPRSLLIQHLSHVRCCKPEICTFLLPIELFLFSFCYSLPISKYPEISLEIQMSGFCEKSDYRHIGQLPHVWTVSLGSVASACLSGAWAFQFNWVPATHSWPRLSLLNYPLAAASIWVCSPVFLPLEK